jgi:hypothetical protein
MERDNGDAEGALEYFKKATLSGNSEHNIWREIALIEQNRKEYAAAYEDFTKALDEPLSYAIDYIMYPGSDYTGQIRGRMDAMQADIGKAAAFGGTKLEFVLNHIAAQQAQSADEALVDKYTKLIAMRPGMGALYSIRGHLLFNKCLLPAALADFRKVAALGNVPRPSLDDARFFIWVILAQSGGEKAATKELQAWLDGTAGPRDGWHVQIGRFLTGGLDESGFLNAAGDTGPGADTTAWRGSEACFYAGAKRLAAGDKTGAVGYFNKSAQSQEKEGTECPAAVAELEMMKPAQP